MWSVVATCTTATCSLWDSWRVAGPPIEYVVGETFTFDMTSALRELPVCRKGDNYTNA